MSFKKLPVLIVLMLSMNLGLAANDPQLLQSRMETTALTKQQLLKNHQESLVIDKLAVLHAHKSEDGQLSIACKSGHAQSKVANSNDQEVEK